MDRQVITVDIAPGSNAQQRLMVSQGDIGRPLGVRIIQNGLPLNCTGYTAHLYVLKPDHNYYECTCTISNNNLISWDTAEQETPVAGECLAEIRITSGTNDIGTACFVEYVEASPADLGYASESLISSMTEYVDAAQQAAEEATEIVEDYDNVNDVAVDSSGHIVLTKVHGSTVTSDETVAQPSDIAPIKNAFLEPTNTALTVNLDDDRTSGYYRISSSSTNTPVSGVAGILIQVRFDTSVAMQQFITTGNALYARIKYGAWGSWKQCSNA